MQKAHSMIILGTVSNLQIPNQKFEVPGNVLAINLAQTFSIFPESF